MFFLNHLFKTSHNKKKTKIYTLNFFCLIQITKICKQPVKLENRKHLFTLMLPSNKWWDATIVNI